MRPSIRKGSGENLTDSAIESVITKLNSDNPITKKAACEELCIAYNTARLTKIIEEYQDRKNFLTNRKKLLRNTPVSKDDESLIVSAYLEGTALQEIADQVYRSVGIIKRTLYKYSVPLRSASVSYFNPVDLNQESKIDNYIEGDLVYSARYDTPAEIISCKKDKKHGMVYKIYLHKDCMYAYQPYYELGDLRKIQSDLDVALQNMPAEEIRELINEGLRNARKRDKDK